MAAPSTNSLALPSAQALQSSEQIALLDAIDELRAHGLGEITALPQLVVCGDQSSGKSSVLEAISGVPFPRKATVCTRFATEVIIRRARAVRLTVSIVPSQDLSAEDQKRISAFRHDLESIDDFAVLFEKAKQTMGISDNKKTFSKDVLRVEFWGPNQPQLTLVDLPGLIHSEIGGQTKDDIKLVNDLVASYLNSPASIILAIVSAKYDINNQVILRRAREVDPDGKRTIGIITKPDTLTDDADEREFIKTARNENVRFVLGWHVVKNLPLGSESTEPGSRDEKETEFFNNSAFSVLPRKDVGIANLRSRLSNILFDQIKVELPRLVEDIESRVRETKAARDRLGPSRLTMDEQRNFLTELSESFQNICRDAVAGHYDHDFFRGDISGERCLCADLMNKHYAFARTLRKRGAYWKIITEEDNDDDKVSGYEDYAGEEDSMDEGDDERNRTREEAIREACKVLKRTRGRELPGLPNPLLVGELFREYSRPWEGLARDHIKDVWNTTKLFLELVLQYLTDGDVRDKILRYWLDPIMERNLELAEEKLKELLEVHKDHPMTTNHDFVMNRRKLQQKRSEETPTADMDLVAAEDAFDNMNAYYKVAMNLFMDCVPTLAIQAPIVRRLPAMFSPVALSKMDPEIIKKIAGESEEKVHERNETLRNLKKFENGARICKEYSLRRSSGNVTSEAYYRLQTLIELASHPPQGSGNVASRPGPGDRRAADRRASASVSEDGRAASQAGAQRTDPALSTRPGNNLGVPAGASIQRPASTGAAFGGQVAAGGGGLFSQPSNSSSAFGGTSNKSGLGFSNLPGFGSGQGFGSAAASHSTTSTSAPSNTPGTFGTSSFNFGRPANPAPSAPPSTSLFSNSGFGGSNQTGSTSSGLFSVNTGSSLFGSTPTTAKSNKGSDQGPAKN